MDRTWMPLVAGVAALALGCGGGDDGPSLKEFASDANAECAKSGAAIKKLGQPETPGAAREWARKSAAAFETSLDAMEKLDRPGGDDGKTASDFVAAYDADIRREYLERLKTIEDAGDAEIAEELAALAGVRTPKSDRLAEKIGAPACADPSG